MRFLKDRFKNDHVISFQEMTVFDIERLVDIAISKFSRVNVNRSFTINRRATRSVSNAALKLFHMDIEGFYEDGTPRYDMRDYYVG